MLSDNKIEADDSPDNKGDTDPLLEGLPLLALFIPSVESSADF
jgi:hypothetical protein